MCVVQAFLKILFPLIAVPLVRTTVLTLKHLVRAPRSILASMRLQAAVQAIMVLEFPQAILRQAQITTPFILTLKRSFILRATSASGRRRRVLFCRFTAVDCFQTTCQSPD